MMLYESCVSVTLVLEKDPELFGMGDKSKKTVNLGLELSVFPHMACTICAMYSYIQNQNNTVGYSIRRRCMKANSTVSYLAIEAF